MKKALIVRFFIRSLALNLAISLFPLCLFSVVMTQYVNRSVTHQAETALETSLTASGDNTSRIFDQAASLVFAFNQPTIYNNATSILRSNTSSYEDMLMIGPTTEWMMSIANAHSFIDSFYIYITNGYDRLLSSSGGLKTLNELQDVSWYDEITRNNGEKSEWVSLRPYATYAVEADSGRMTLSLFRQMRGNRCWVVMNLSAPYLTQMLKNSLLYEGQEIFLTDEAGNVLVSTSSHAEMPADVSADPAQNGDRFRMMKKSGHLLSSIPLGRYSLSLVSLVPADSVYQMSLMIRRICFLLLAACIVVCLVLSSSNAMRERNKLRTLYQLIDMTNDDTLPPARPIKAYDEYSYIEQNIVSSFLRQNNLRLELQQKNYEAKSMELLALQAQINPHFLVNTLRTVYWKTASVSGSTETEPCNMLEDLCEMFYLMTGNPNDLVPFSQEQRYLNCYLSLQSKRFTDKFTFAWDVAPDCAEYPVLKMLLQPLVENCLQHAMPADGVLNIALKARVEENELVITLSDDGVGIPPETLQSLREGLGTRVSYKHIGLSNTAKRIMLRYDVSSPLSIDSAPGTGTAVVLRIPPLRRDPEPPDDRA